MINEARNRALCIHPEYDQRPNAIAFDDRSMRDEWQDFVYRWARDWAVRNDARRILDWGCGSGYKLMKYFSAFQTVGYDVDTTLMYLLTHYPEREWKNIEHVPRFTGDLLISADVIEHMAEPARFLSYVAQGPVQNVILSTPALEILAERGESPRLGPPDNQSHYREWTTREFRDFVAMHLTVIEHVIDARQGTQMILAVRK